MGAPFRPSGHISVDVSPSLIEKLLCGLSSGRFCSRENGLAPFALRLIQVLLQVSASFECGHAHPHGAILVHLDCVRLEVGKRGVDNDQAENYSKAQT